MSTRLMQSIRQDRRGTEGSRRSKFFRIMAPNVSSRQPFLEKNHEENDFDAKPTNATEKFDSSNYERKTGEPISGPFGMKTPLIWSNIIFIFLFHVALLYGLLTFDYLANGKAMFWGVATGTIAGLGVTAGVHRLWAHRSYKAKWPMRVLLLFCFYMAGQNNVYDWVRDHRVHHKYTDTDADPHNSNRGFFFSHMGWLMMKKHPEVLRKGNQIDMSDILEDPVVAFGDKHFRILKILCAFVIPVLIPVYFWNETWDVAFKSQVLGRYAAGLHITWSVNSAAHIWGTRPYISSINPVQNIYVSIFALGEGWHNYHHAFPWDYKAAEFGPMSTNLTRYFIEFFSKIGWAYDLREPSVDLVRKTTIKKGDGSHPTWVEVSPPTESKENGSGSLEAEVDY